MDCVDRRRTAGDELTNQRRCSISFLRVAEKRDLQKIGLFFERASPCPAM
jgi:hypothetical protein